MKDKKVQVVALVDSGANAMFINKNVVTKNNLEYTKLAVLRTVQNADGTENKGGIINSYVHGQVHIGFYKSIS